jgi:hypothetical protein
MGTRPTSGLGGEALWPLTADPGPWRVGVALHSRSRSDLSKVLAGLVVASVASRWRAWDRRSRAIARDWKDGKPDQVADREYDRFGPIVSIPEGGLPWILPGGLVVVGGRQSQHTRHGAGRHGGSINLTSTWMEMGWALETVRVQPTIVKWALQSYLSWPR